MPSEKLRDITLKDGSRAELWLIQAPDLEWQPRLRAYLNNPPVPDAPALHEFLLAHDLPGLNVSYFTMVSADSPKPDIMGCIFTTDGAGSSYINSTFVAREYRQRGIARILMDTLEADLEGRGARVRFLTTRTGSPAEDLFVKVGYRVKYERGGRTGMEKLYGDTTWESYFDLDETELSVRDVVWGDWNPHRTMTWARDDGSHHPLDGNIFGLMRDRVTADQTVWKGLFSPDGRMVGNVVVRRKDAFVPEDDPVSVVDLYVHPGYEGSADRLLEGASPSSGRLQTFLNGASGDAIARFEAHGFSQETNLKDDFNHHDPSTPDIRVYTRR